MVTVVSVFATCQLRSQPSRNTALALRLAASLRDPTTVHHASRYSDGSNSRRRRLRSRQEYMNIVRLQERELGVTGIYPGCDLSLREEFAARKAKERKEREQNCGGGLGEGK